MSITVTDVKYTEISAIKIDSTYTIISPATITVYYTKNKKQHLLILNLKQNFRTDGASIPKAFQWFLPKWDTKNMKYNCGAIVHDCLYTTKGVNGIFSREEADDFIRGIWRCSGINRFKASTADMCLYFFGGGSDHWGNDDLNNKKNKLISFDVLDCK